MSAPYAGQVSVSGTAQALSSTPVTVAAFVVKAPATNVNPIYIGPSTVTTSNGHQLDPGDVFEYERSNFNGQNAYQLGPADIYVVGTSPDKATFFASPSSS